MLASMALQLSPELEQRVTELAHAIQRDPAVVLAELVADALDDDEEETLRLHVAESLAQIKRRERREGIPDEDAMRELRARLERLGLRPR
jgi:predicted transcriptional regulator